VLNLLADNKFQQTPTLVIAGPRQPVSQAEVDLLKQYLVQAALIAMLEPLPVTEFETP
jgi:hypothetical protein